MKTVNTFLLLALFFACVHLSLQRTPRRPSAGHLGKQMDKFLDGVRKRAKKQIRNNAEPMSEFFWGNENKCYPNAEESCLGAVGPKCQGAPFADKRPGTKPGTVNMAVSVGSILHDSCCVKYPWGKYCNGIPLGVAQDLLQSISFMGDIVPCSKEWRKAVFNVVSQRQWRHEFPTHNVKVCETDARPAAVPNQANVYEPYAGKEMTETKKLEAPSGTRLDTTDAAYCKSKRFASFGTDHGGAYGVCA